MTCQNHYQCALVQSLNALATDQKKLIKQQEKTIQELRAKIEKSKNGVFVDKLILN